MSKQYITISGNVGKDPQTSDTRAGQVVRFSVAQRTGYGDQDTRWYNVAVFNAGLIAGILQNVRKGTRVVVEGFAEENQYNGQSQWQIVGDRVGLLNAFVPTKRGAPAATVTTVDGYSDDV